jgi:polyphosphate kinase
MSAPKPRLKEKERASEAPAPVAPPAGPARYFNRELSWLQFNRRVLEEANNLSHPLLERLRFLSISASNLDEFYMVRVAGLYGQVDAGIVHTSQDGLTPAQQLAEINRFAGALVSDQQACWSALKAEMGAAAILIVEPKELTSPERAWLEQEFLARYLPILTPIAVDPAHPFPFIQNGGVTVGLELRRERDASTMHALLPIPSQLARFIRLPAEDALLKEADAPIRFIRIESVIGMFVTRLFPGFIARSQGAFRVLRDSDIEVQEEAEDLVAQYETALKRRRRGDVIRLEIDGQMPTRLQRFVVQELDFRDEGVFIREGMLGLADTAQLIVPEIWLSSRSRSVFPSASASSTATALRPSARRTSWCTTPTNPSTWWCSCCARPSPTPTSWPSSGRSIAPPTTARSYVRSRMRPISASR